MSNFGRFLKNSVSLYGKTLVQATYLSIYAVDEAISLFSELKDSAATTKIVKHLDNEVEHLWKETTDSKRSTEAKPNEQNEEILDVLHEELKKARQSERNAVAKISRLQDQLVAHKRQAATPAQISQLQEQLDLITQNLNEAHTFVSSLHYAIINQVTEVLERTFSRVVKIQTDINSLQNETLILQEKLKTYQKKDLKLNRFDQLSKELVQVSEDLDQTRIHVYDLQNSTKLIQERLANQQSKNSEPDQVLHLGKELSQINEALAESHAHIVSSQNNIQRIQIDLRSPANKQSVPSLAQILSTAANKFDDVFVVWDSAWDSAELSNLKDEKKLQKIYNNFEALALISRERFILKKVGHAPVDLNKAFIARGINHYKENETKATKAEFGNERVFRKVKGNNGTCRTVWQHLTIDGYTQVYFEINDALGKVDIVYCGEHLPISSFKPN